MKCVRERVVSEMEYVRWSAHSVEVGHMSTATRRGGTGEERRRGRDGGGGMAGAKAEAVRGGGGVVCITT
jgi:hypothetical protein